MKKRVKIHWGIEIADDMIGNGFGYKVHSHNLKEAVSKIADITPEAKNAVIITSPEFYPAPIPDKVNFLFTMFEGTILPKLYEENIGKAHYLLTPSTWVQKLMKKYFDSKKIFVVPHGIGKEFTYVNRGYPKLVPFRYLWVGAANARKGWEELGKVWESIFKHDQTCELYIKTTGKEKVWKKGNVIVDSRNLSKEKLIDLYHAAHCFVFPTRGEGFAFTLAEAMATGLPAIATNYSGLTDFFNSYIGYPIGYRLGLGNLMFPKGVIPEDKPQVATTVIAYPDLTELATAMIHVRLNYGEALAKGREASKLIKKDFTWGRAAKRLVGIIEKYGDHPETAAPVMIRTKKEYKKVITMTAFKRPKYTRRVIQGLKNCTGIEGYTLFANIEPGNDDVQKLFKDIDFMEVKPVVNDFVYGINENTFQALFRGFKYSTFVIHLEDDTLPAKDMLKYFEWAKEKYENDANVFTICTYNKIDVLPPKEDYYSVFKKEWFTPWGWATWLDRWEAIEQLWHYNIGLSWDIYVNKMLRNDRKEIRPILARAQNIGAEEGYFVPDKEWHETHQYNGIWAGSVDLLENAKFKEKT